MDNKSFEREVLDRLKTIEVKLDDYNQTKKESSDAYTLSRENQKEIDELKDKMKWLSRTITASIISIIIGAVVYVIKIM